MFLECFIKIPKTAYSTHPYKFDVGNFFLNYKYMSYNIMRSTNTRLKRFKKIKLKNPLLLYIKIKYLKALSVYIHVYRVNK